MTHPVQTKHTSKLLFILCSHVDANLDFSNACAGRNFSKANREADTDNPGRLAILGCAIC
jgi:hypothetical protein